MAERYRVTIRLPPEQERAVKAIAKKYRLTDYECAQRIFALGLVTLHRAGSDLDVAETTTSTHSLELLIPPEVRDDIAYLRRAQERLLGLVLENYQLGRLTADEIKPGSSERAHSSAKQMFDAVQNDILDAEDQG